MRQKQLFKITGMDGNDYTITLSGIGREYAAKRLLICHYIGPAPVSVAAYTAPYAVRTSGWPSTSLCRRWPFRTYVDQAIPGRAGTGAHHRNKIFLYGPTGKGKTSVVRLESVWAIT